MTPLAIYTLFVLPALALIAAAGFIIYGRRELRLRHIRAEKQRQEQEAADRRRAEAVGRIARQVPDLRLVG